MAAPTISLITGPQDPSQLDALLNTVINSANAFLTGIGGNVLTVPVSAASTATAISPTAGAVSLNSTTRTAGTTGRYSLTNPSYAGEMLRIKNLSTVKAVITGAFERSKTKLSLSSTAALASCNLPGVILTALSTSAWGISASTGKILST